MGLTVDSRTGGGPALLAVTWLFAAVASVTLALRYYSSRWVKGVIRIDFWLALCTWLVAITAQIILTIAVGYGTGTHMRYLTPQQFATSQKFGWICQFLDLTAMALGKIAVVAYLIQIRGPHSPRPWFLWFIGATTVLVNALAIIFALVSCRPVSALWSQKPGADCSFGIVAHRFALFQGAWSAFCDASLALYPVTIIWNLNMKLRMKVGLCVLMGLGLITAVCSSIRTYNLNRPFSSTDFSYNATVAIIWTTVEMWVILSIGCVPPIRPLFVHVFHKVSTSVTSKLGGSQATHASAGVKRPGARSSVHHDDIPLHRSNRDYKTGVYGEHDESPTSSKYNQV